MGETRAVVQWNQAVTADQDGFRLSKKENDYDDA